MPVVKIDSTQREVPINSSYLRMKNDRDKDDSKLVNLRRQQKKQNIDLLGEKTQEVFYKLGDVVLFEESKVHGYVIEADDNTVKVVTEYN